MEGFNMARARIFLLLVLLLIPARAWAEPTEEQAKALTALRSAMSSRKLAEIEPALKAAQALQGETAYDTELNRLELLAKYVQGFWTSVDKGAQAALNAGELKVGDEPIAIVDYDRRTFVIRKAGENKRYTIETIPPRLALTVSNLEPEAANNKVFFGAFLAMDAQGDRRLARQYWDDAARGGAEVKFLLPELEVKLPAPPITLPELTPPLKAALSPAQWQLRFKTGTRYDRKPLGKLGEQNEEGRLIVEVSELEEPALLQKTRTTGDFQCRIYLQGVQAGQSFGLFSTLPNEPPQLVELPEGTVQVDLARKQGTYYCRINNEDVEVKTEKAIKAGYVGVTLLEGRTLTVGGFGFSP